MANAVHDAVEQLLARTGVGRQIAAEREKERADKVAAARKTKAAAISKFLAERDRLQPLLKAAEADQAAAVKAAEAAIQRQIRLREQFSAIHDEVSLVQAPLDAELLANAHPAIDQAVQELEARKKLAPTLHRVIPDRSGPLVINATGGRGRDNSREVREHVLSLNAAIEALGRLKVAPGAIDEAAEISRILNTVVEVNP